NRRITATPLEIRPKLKNRHGVQRTLTNKEIIVLFKNKKREMNKLISLFLYIYSLKEPNIS
ncbi:hypothetical protein, partial [Acinetobacter pittii]|uniref:hypothetical protein n=1 Tax=Acinetobacter pittii TaxID=48296 RepID=UPI001BB46E15